MHGHRRTRTKSEWCEQSSTKSLSAVSWSRVPTTVTIILTTNVPTSLVISFEVMCDWGQLIIWVCVGFYMEVRDLWWLKGLPRRTLYLNVWRWSLVRPDACLFSLQTANTKCIGPYLYGEMGCTKSSEFVHHVVVVRFVPELFFSTRTVP